MSALSRLKSLLPWNAAAGTDLVPVAAPFVASDTEITRPIRGASVNKNNAYWQPELLSGNTAIQQSWYLLTSRLRDLCVNDPLFQKVANQLCSLVIADGLYAYAAAVDKSGTEIDDYNDESDVLWELWADEEADADGEKSLYEMQRLSWTDLAAVGNCLWIRVMQRSPDRISPLSYKLVEWEQLAQDWDTTSGLMHGMPANNRIINGIEYTPNNRKAAFWIYEEHPYDAASTWVNVPTRFPASRVIHNYLPSRISDTTGLSWYAAMMQPAKDRDTLVGNTLTSTAIQALLTLVVKRSALLGSTEAADDLDETSVNTGQAKVGMGYPYIAQVGADDDVQVAESRKNLADLKGFADMLWTLESMGAKLSVNRVLGDPTRANMASIRASHEDDDALMSPLRTHQARRVARGIRKVWTRLAIAQRKITSITPETFAADPNRYLAFEVVGSHRGDVSPQEEVEAAHDRLRGGLTTYPHECGRMGTNWRRNIRRMSQVNRYSERHEVILDWSKGQGGQLERSSSIPAPPEEKEEGSQDADD